MMNQDGIVHCGSSSFIVDFIFVEKFDRFCEVNYIGIVFRFCFCFVFGNIYVVWFIMINSFPLGEKLEMMKINICVSINALINVMIEGNFWTCSFTNTQFVISFRKECQEKKGQIM